MRHSARETAALSGSPWGCPCATYVRILSLPPQPAWRAGVGSGRGSATGRRAAGGGEVAGGPRNPWRSCPLPLFPCRPFLWALPPGPSIVAAGGLGRRAVTHSRTDGCFWAYRPAVHVPRRHRVLRADLAPPWKVGAVSLASPGLLTRGLAGPHAPLTLHRQRPGGTRFTGPSRGAFLTGGRGPGRGTRVPFAESQL